MGLRGEEGRGEMLSNLTDLYKTLYIVWRPGFSPRALTLERLSLLLLTSTGLSYLTSELVGGIMEALIVSAAAFSAR